MVQSNAAIQCHSLKLHEKAAACHCLLQHLYSHTARCSDPFSGCVCVQVQELQHAAQQTEQQQASQLQAAESRAEEACFAAALGRETARAELQSVEAALATARARLEQQTHTSYKMSREWNNLNKQVRISLLA